MKKRALPVAEEAKFQNMHKLSIQSFRKERFEMISLMLEELVRVQQEEPRKNRLEIKTSLFFIQIFITKYF